MTRQVKGWRRGTRGGRIRALLVRIAGVPAPSGSPACPLRADRRRARAERIAAAGQEAFAAAISATISLSTGTARAPKFSSTRAIGPDTETAVGIGAPGSGIA